jgi:alanyl-tRNA synthetase
MALKAKISKADYDKLSDALKAAYVADGDNFVLDVEGAEDTGALKRAKEHEANARKKAEKDLRDAQAKLDEIEAEAAAKTGDVDAKIKAATKKIETERDAAVARADKLQTFAQKTLVDNTAIALAGEISKSPKLLLPHIKDRLAVDFDGDEPVLRVKGADGNPLAGGLDKLKTEFVANKDFADIIIASKASGSGGADQRTSNGGGATNHPDPNAPAPNLLTAKPGDLRSRIDARVTARREQNPGA